MIELGTPKDIDELLRLEDLAFTSDKISRQRFQRFLKDNGKKSVLIVSRQWTTTNIDHPEHNKSKLNGYVLTLHHPLSKVARIHSYAVDPESRGLGLGAMLLEAAAMHATCHYKCNAMRTEIRADNPHAIARYSKSGFKHIGMKANYYSDGCDSVTYEKPLLQKIRPQFQMTGA